MKKASTFIIKEHMFVRSPSPNPDNESCRAIHFEYVDRLARALCIAGVNESHPDGEGSSITASCTITRLADALQYSTDYFWQVTNLGGYSALG